MEGGCGGGAQNSEDDRDWSCEFWFLKFLDQQRNEFGPLGIMCKDVHGHRAPLSITLMEMSSERNLTDCGLSSFLSLKSGLY